MIQKIKRWLAPPFFPDDELKTRRARLLNGLLLITIGVALMVSVGNVLGGRTPWLTTSTNVTIAFISFGCVYLLRRGHITAAGVLLLILGWIEITVASASLGTIRTPTTTVYLLPVIGATIIFDRRGLIVATVLSSSSVLGLIVAENGGWLPRPDYTVTVTQWLMYTGLFAGIGALTHIAQGVAHNALARAKTELSERKHVEQELRKLLRAVEQSPTTIVITNCAGDIEYVNPRFTQTTGYAVAEALGKNPRILKSEHTPAQVYAEMWRTIKAGGEWRGEFQNKKKNGEVYWEAATIAPIWDEHGAITHFLAVKEDITERKRAEAELHDLQNQLREQAIRDPLTHLFNRRYLNETLPPEIARAVRHHTPLGIVMLDLDHFKQINDTLGHLTGDVVIESVGRLIQAQLRESDMVCRYGGEEILCVLPDTTQDDVLRRVEQLRAQIAQTMVDPAHPDLRITGSFGIAMFPAHGTNVTEILKAADAALYRAKQDGRNCVRIANT